MVAGMSIQMWLWCEINASVWPCTSLGPVKNLKNWEGRTGRHPFPNRWFICHPLFHIPTRCSLIQLFIMHLKLSPCLSIGPVNLSIRFPCHRLILFNAKQVFFLRWLHCFSHNTKKKMVCSQTLCHIMECNKHIQNKMHTSCSILYHKPCYKHLESDPEEYPLPFLSSTPEF